MDQIYWRSCRCQKATIHKYMEWKVRHLIWGKFSTKADGKFEISSKSLVGVVEDSGGSIPSGENLVPKQTGNLKFHKT